MPSLIESTIEEFRQRLAAGEAEEMGVMAQRWMEVEGALAGRVDALAQLAADLRSQGKTVTGSQIQKSEQFSALLRQAQAEVQRYAGWAAAAITEQQRAMSAMGIDAATAMIRATYLDAGQVGAYFNVLAVEAVEAMIGYAGNGSPLGKLLMRDYPETALRLTQELIDGTAMGRNPRDTARAMLDAMGGNLNQALTVARTEQLRVFREASRQQMIKSGVVDGYIRRAALNDRTCIACIALDGEEYETDVLMEVHPNDRCFMQPKVRGLAPVDVENGEAWFLGQDAETQRAMLGPGAYEAWQAGQINLRDMASTHVDATWGPTVNVTPLSELVH